MPTQHYLLLVNYYYLVNYLFNFVGKKLTQNQLIMLEKDLSHHIGKEMCLFKCPSERMVKVL